MKKLSISPIRQSVWGFNHIMQISAFQVLISLLINRDIYVSLIKTLIKMQISVIEKEISLIEMRISVFEIQISVF